MIQANRRRIWVCLLFSLLAASIWYYLSQDPIEKVNGYLDELELVLSMPADQKGGLIAAAREGMEAAEYCTEEPSIELFPGQIHKSRNQLAGIIGHSRQAVDSAIVTLRDRVIELKDDKVIVRLRGRVVADRGGDRIIKNHRYELIWVEVDGDWLIERCKIIGR